MKFWSDFIAFVSSHRDELLEQSLEHIYLTLVALFFSVIIGLALGIAAGKNSRLERVIMVTINGIQTIPSIALLGFMIPLLGIGETPAIVALFLYGLLPIVKNTITGIKSVDAAIIESAYGMGFRHRDVLIKVELPLAAPVIFAGIRVAFVINIGVATLCALIAAGGLGEFIFRGLSTNNPHMILAGAIPAAMLALIFDGLLGILQKHIYQLIRPLLMVAGILFLAVFIYFFLPENRDKIVAGFPSEFIERGDGYRGLVETYNLDLEVKEMEIGLMYEAVRNGNVDVISGFSTDGRIKAFNLKPLEDDLNYFPPYHAAPLIRREVLTRYPGIKTVFDSFSGTLSDGDMRELNYLVDEENQSPKEVAKDYLESRGFELKEVGNNRGPDIILGSKNFTESYILAEMFKLLIESELNLKVDMKPGFGGTLMIFEALKSGNIDIYPEYSGTGLLVILKDTSGIAYQRDSVMNYVKGEFEKRYDLTWLPPLGFNNTFILMVRDEYAREKGLNKISDIE